MKPESVYRKTRYKYHRLQFKRCAGGCAGQVSLDGDFCDECVRTKQIRQCMMCHQRFLSKWRGHRICSKCKTTALYRDGE